MNISRRLFIGFTLITVLAVIVGAVGIAGMKELRRAGISMYEQQVMSLEYLGRATGALKQVRLDGREVIINSFYDDQKGAADAQKQFESSAREFIYWMDEAYAIASADELIEFHDIIIRLFNDIYLTNAGKINSASIADMPDHINNLEIKVLLASINDVSDQMESLIIGMMDLNSAIAKQTSDYNDKMTQYLILVQYFMLTAAIAIAVIVSLYITKNITAAYMTIDKQNKTILSSIDYAGKIQNNMLPAEEEFRKVFSDYSVLWKPRDIVGGDIYWLKNFNEGTVLCVCDCTGHGTPGALLTMLVVSAFETIVNEANCKDTAEIIWRLEQRLVDVLHVNTPEQIKNRIDDIKDGCDLAVLFIAKDGDVTLSSGNTHVFVCDGKEVTQIKGQRIYVGEGRLKSRDDVKTVKIPGNPDNKFYVASDGLYDQKGGARNNPFGYRTFKQLILENHNEKQEVISDKIWEAFENYRSNGIRLDDFELITFKP